MKFFICCLLFFVSLKSIGQTKIDTIIQNYLLKNKEIDTIIYKEKKEKNIVSIESNYFRNKFLDLKDGNYIVKGYKFGSNSVHRTSFVLLDFFYNDIHDYVFFGMDGFESDLENLIQIFRSNKYKFKNSNKKKMIQAVMSIYH